MIKKTMAMLLLGIFVLGMIPINTGAFQTNSNANIGIINPPIKGGQYSEIYSDLKASSTNLENRWTITKQELNREMQTSSRDIRGKKPDTDSTATLEKYKEFLELTIDRVINRLQRLGYWVERVVEDEKVRENFLNIIDEEINELESMKKEIRGAQSMDELRGKAKEIREKWSETNTYVKRMVGFMLGIRLDNILDELSSLSDRLHSKVDGLDQNNKLVGKMQNLLDDFDEKIGLANEEYNNYMTGNTLTVSSDYSNEIKARNTLNKVHEYLREAHDILKEFLKLYREYLLETSPETSSKPINLEETQTGGYDEE